MKRLSMGHWGALLCLMAILCFLVTGIVPAFAGDVGERTFVTLGTATGTGTWTNDHQFAAVNLRRISVVSNSDADNVVTVSRIITDSDSTAYTQTVGTITCESSVGTIETPLLDGLLTGRAFVALSVDGGAATWTNDGDTPATELTRLSVANSLNATNEITCTRIITDSDSTAYTQTVGTVTCSGGAGTQATLAYADLVDDDVLSFSSLVSTGSTVIAEYDARKALPDLEHGTLKYGDVLSFSSSTATGGVAVVEFEVEKH